MIDVYTDGNNIIIKRRGITIIMSQSEGKLLMKKLADIYGYRLSSLKPSITYRYDPVSKMVRIIVHEGKTTKDASIPVDVLLLYLEVMKRLGQGKFKKRDIVRLVADEMMKNKKLRNKISQYYSDNTFDFERFFGSRVDYYELYRAPILLLYKFGIAKEKGATIEITEAITKIRDLDLLHMLDSENKKSKKYKGAPTSTRHGDING